MSLKAEFELSSSKAKWNKRLGQNPETEQTESERFFRVYLRVGEGC